MLTVREVAERLGIGESTVYQLVACGRLGSHRLGLGRGTIRITSEDVDAYLDSCRHHVSEDDDEEPPRQTPLRHIRL